MTQLASLLASGTPASVSMTEASNTPLSLSGTAASDSSEASGGNALEEAEALPPPMPPIPPMPPNIPLPLGMGMLPDGKLLGKPEGNPDGKLDGRLLGRPEGRLEGKPEGTVLPEGVAEALDCGPVAVALAELATVLTAVADALALS